MELKDIKVNTKRELFDFIKEFVISNLGNKESTVKQRISTITNALWDQIEIKDNYYENKYNLIKKDIHLQKEALRGIKNGKIYSFQSTYLIKDVKRIDYKNEECTILFTDNSKVDFDIEMTKQIRMIFD